MSDELEQALDIIKRMKRPERERAEMAKGITPARVYKDIDGNECSLWQMVAREPEWAGTRIKEGEKAIEEARSMRVQVAELEDILRRIEAVTVWDAVPDGRKLQEDVEAVLSGNPSGQKVLQTLRSGIASVIDLMNNSEGVASLHLNGDVAPWDSLRKGGQFEEWLRDLDEAAKLLGNGNGNGAS